MLSSPAECSFPALSVVVGLVQSWALFGRDKPQRCTRMDKLSYFVTVPILLSQFLCKTTPVKPMARILALSMDTVFSLRDSVMKLFPSRIFRHSIDICGLGICYQYEHRVDADCSYLREQGLDTLLVCKMSTRI